MTWSEAEGDQVTGELTPGGEVLELRGLRRGRLVERRLAYRDLASVRIARMPPELLDGEPTLVLERLQESALLVRPHGYGLLHELADLLTKLCARREPIAKIALLLPLKPDAQESARELIAEGPPFDPADKSLAQHEVFLTEHEVIFVFSGEDACESVRQIMSDASVWPIAGRWSTCLEGPPRLAEASYSWTPHA